MCWWRRRTRQWWWLWWRRTQWLWWRRTDAPLRVLGLGASLLGPTSSPLTLLRAGLLGPTGRGVRNKRSVGAAQPTSPLFLQHPCATWGRGATCSPFALVQGAEGCRCFGSDRAPRVAPQGAFWSRTVLPTVARWFVPDARETVDNFVQVRAALRRVIPYVLTWILCVVGYKGVL
jgi:hypothetical protein